MSKTTPELDFSHNDLHARASESAYYTPGPKGQVYKGGMGRITLYRKVLG